MEKIATILFTTMVECTMSVLTNLVTILGVLPVSTSHHMTTTHINTVLLRTLDMVQMDMERLAMGMIQQSQERLVYP